jgi:phage baseplate assembly protein W
MAISTIVRTFRDLDLNFTKHPSTGDVSSRVGDQAVIRSVRNLIYLGHYEKPFHPEIGSSIRQLLFENMNPLTTQHIKRAIEDTIINFEPRVQLKDVVVQTKEDLNQFQVSIEFYIRNNATPTKISFFLERAR